MIALRTLKAIASFQSKLPREQEASAMEANARKEIEIPNQNVFPYHCEHDSCELCVVCALYIRFLSSSNLTFEE